METIFAVGKCFKVSNDRGTYLFKVSDFKTQRDPYFGLEYVEIVPTKAFKVTEMQISQKNHLSFGLPMMLCYEIEEKDLDKIEHAYKAMRTVIMAVLSKINSK